MSFDAELNQDRERYHGPQRMAALDRICDAPDGPGNQGGGKDSPGLMATRIDRFPAPATGFGLFEKGWPNMTVKILSAIGIVLALWATFDIWTEGPMVQHYYDLRGR